MKIHNDGSVVIATILFQDRDGNTVTPQSATYRVYDQDGVVIVAPTVHTITGGDTEASITINSVDNTLGADELRVARVVELTMTTASGEVYVNTHRYIIEPIDVLDVMQGSYQTFEMAHLMALGIANLTAWDAATDQQKKAALSEAFHHIGKMKFAVGHPNELNHLSGYTEISDLNALTWEEFEALDIDFIEAVRKAQVVEADTLLGGDPIDDQRQGGLMSSSVGEVSQMYRPGKPVQLAVSRRALKFLTGYIRYGVAIGRGS